MALGELYGHSLALLTDLYQLTMAYGYWKLGMADREAVFCLQFRKNPFDGGYTIACGLQNAIEYLERLKFDDEDLRYLATIKGNDGEPLFESRFLSYLGGLRLSIDVDAVSEGTVVFPYEPLVRVTGPILQCQLAETPLLNIINFQSLIATKAARVCWAAKGDDVIEFGLRRAQGIDGGVSASRAAYIGGCVGTSNVLAGKLFGIPVRGTHAHSWVMLFDDELESFERYADVMPNNCVFLVDTYGTLEGVRNAVKVGKRLLEEGHKMIGIRLDSGDLAYLSIEARKILDDSGFRDAVILASNDLDEHIIGSLKEQGAKISAWGVGTKLATAYDQPALGGVYKLTAVKDERGEWDPRMKLSEQMSKSSIPGILQTRRFRKGGEFVADAIFDEIAGFGDSEAIVDPRDPSRTKRIPKDCEFEDLLIPIIRNGETVAPTIPIPETRDRAAGQLAMLHPGIKRFLNPHEYPAGLEHGLHLLRNRLRSETRSNS